MTRKALIVIDLQNDYFKNGKMELYNIDTALKNTNRLIEFARNNKYEIFFIKHLANTNKATFFIPNSYGAELYKDLNIQNDKIITKHYPNSFRETKLQKELENLNITSLIICGAMTHMCIDTTVRAGYDLGYNITLAHDACATKDLIFNNQIIKAHYIQNGFISALDGTFCTALSTNDITN